MTPRTFVEVLRERAAGAPAGRGYSFWKEGEGAPERLDYAQLDLRARALAVRLARRGAADGERVLLPLPPGADFVAALFGCLYAGALAVPLPAPDPAKPAAGLAALERVARDCQARFSFLPLPGLEPVDAPADAALAQAWSAPALGEDTPALLQYTSGSTSEPKGVVVRHANLLANARAIQRVFGVDEHSRGVSWLPPYHDMGLMGGILEPMLIGACTLLMPPQAFLQRPLRWLQAISDTRATTCGGPDFAYDLLARRVPESAKAGLDLSCWSVAFCGAEPLRPATLDAFAAAFAGCGFRREAFLPCYGLAEATLLVTGARAGKEPTLLRLAPDEAHRPGRVVVGCGRAPEGVAVAVVEPESGAPRPEREVGEIWVKGPGVAAGYWGNPEETRRAFGARRADGDGPYLRTGDLGFLDGGELFPTGRLKDLLIVRGRNLYPQDIEATLERAHDAVRPGRAAAFQATLAGREQLVVACEIQRRARHDQDQIAETLRAAVAAEHGVVPDAALLLPPGTLPRTSSGKPRRPICRALYEAGQLDPGQPWPGGPS